jgi:hypothetical protein
MFYNLFQSVLKMSIKSWKPIIGFPGKSGFGIPLYPPSKGEIVLCAPPFLSFEGGTGGMSNSGKEFLNAKFPSRL